MGPEPELHRLYVAADKRSRGTGSLLMDELHARIGDAPHMLLVVEGNDGAIACDQRPGLETRPWWTA